ncbi:MAG: YqgE/AlgH family protein [Candidatus Binataceae bacterium]
MLTSVLAGALLVASRSFAAPLPTIASDPYFLVATPDLPDPIFQQSVILILPSASQIPLIAGFIVNKPTPVTVGDVFREVDGLQHPSEKAYFGGPVDYTEPILLMRGDHPAGGATRLANHLYAAAGMGAIAGLLTKPFAPADKRLFLGRAQWSRDQLRSEIKQGAWEILPVDVDLVFSPEPAKLWPKLVQQSHLRQVGMFTLSEESSIQVGGFFSEP